MVVFFSGNAQYSTSLCLMMVNPPVGQERAWSVVTGGCLGTRPVTEHCGLLKHCGSPRNIAVHLGNTAVHLGNTAAHLGNTAEYTGVLCPT